jgi:hypothetical protein
MSVGRIIVNTTVMMLTGSAVQAGVKRGKEWLKDRKDRKDLEAKEEPKEVGSVTQMDE